MSSNIINGKMIANNLLSNIKHKVENIKNHHHVIPGLSIILVGSNSASEIYVKSKMQVAEQLGINCFLIRLPEDTLEKNLITKIENLNNDPKVHGVLVQLPLPDHINKYNVIDKLDPKKDVDGLHPYNIGRLVEGQKALVPATSRGCMKLIESVKPDLSELKILIIGRSNLVGKPLFHLLLNQDCTATIAHSKTSNLKSEISNSDVIIIAIGSAKFLKADSLKKDVIVIDVGINRNDEGKIIGDADFEEISKVASYVSPVPGGVGPMTIACLMENILLALCYARDIDYSKI